MSNARAAAAVVVVLLLAIAANYVQTHKVTTKNCQEIEVVKSGLRDTLKEAEQFVLTSKVRSELEKAEAKLFYGDALQRLKPRPC